MVPVEAHLAAVLPEVARKVAALHLAAVHPAERLVPAAVAAYPVYVHLVADRKAAVPDGGVSYVVRLAAVLAGAFAG